MGKRLETPSTADTGRSPYLFHRYIGITIDRARFGLFIDVFDLLNANTAININWV
jgi:hypothetical protein